MEPPPTACGDAWALRQAAGLRERRKGHERDRRIIELWLDRREQQPTAAEAWSYFGWLSDHYSEVIPSRGGSYAHVRRW